MALRQKIGLAGGPLLFALILTFYPFADLNSAANAVLATAVWMAVWWLSEAVPIAVTALLPIALLPLSGGAEIEQTTAAYGDKMLFLFLGGFIIAIAMQKWNLHRRIALYIISKIGVRSDGILLGFMLSTGLLSMWISNTATTLMMITIGAALIKQIKEVDKGKGSEFFKPLLLGIAFSASIGGVATLVGTPTNPIFAAIASSLYGENISFISWMTFALPFAVAMLFICWMILTRGVFKCHSAIPMGKDVVVNELEKLGKIGAEERAVAFVFSLTALLWILRSSVLTQILPGINDTVIAICAAVSLFVIPSKKEGSWGLLTWEEAAQLPWGVIILFGGGLALAAAFQSSGLAEWIGSKLTTIGSLPLIAAILIVALATNFLTEVTSNVATASILLPVLASLAEAIGLHPYFLMVPATMAASCAFMLPIATGPNAIAFSVGEIQIKDMVRAGIWLNLISSVLISLLVYWLVPILF
ncbi:MAG: DASS family sodium-coupled anion symporter [Bacteroidota bacterium]